MYSLANFNILARSLDTLEQIALSSPTYSRLDAMGYPLNRSDGGLGLARISVELGSLITVILVIYVALLTKLLKQGATVRRRRSQNHVCSGCYKFIPCVGVGFLTHQLFT